jgi:hypothetical protein
MQGGSYLCTGMQIVVFFPFLSLPNTYSCADANHDMLVGARCIGVLRAYGALY